ncbi:IscS subfamily cysteine desulfurase [Gracilibacillus marinus]|jgi:cysteine desulfurase|uniref:IscS subfamily cysteine desulfurase n=1 Tax=Gracilibacillus marinus TaxID=630535 RepID=A0ABV8VYS6_9BACI
MIYCDYAATTPMLDEAMDIYSEINRSYFGNASSLHDFGTKANDYLRHARELIAHCFRAKSENIIFTNGGTEGNILAINTLLRSIPTKDKPHVISTMMEHSSIYYHLLSLEKENQIDVTFLEGNKEGHITIEQVIHAIKPSTKLVTIQYVNGETGVKQPIEEISALLSKKNILFHSDFVQSFGKIHTDVTQLPIDAITVSSHKIYGPKSVGAIYFRNPHVLVHHPIETNHEFGLRPGTVDVAAICAFAVSAKRIHEIAVYEHLYQVRAYFINQLKQKEIPLLPLCSKNSCPSIVGCISNEIQGDYLLLEYNRFNIAISTGSACALGQQEIPRAVLPLLDNEEDGKRYIRFSFSHLTTFEEIDTIIMVSAKIFQRLEEARLAYG